VLVDHQLAVGRALLERGALEGAAVVVGHVAQEVLGEHEEASVDVAVRRVGLLGEAAHARTVDRELAEPARRADARDRGELAVLLVERDRLRHVDVRQAVTVGEQEVRRLEVLRDAGEPRAGHRLGAGVHAGDAPVAPGRAVVVDPVRGRQVDREVGLHRREVEEVALDRVGHVAEAQDEVLVPVAGVERHDVPEDRLARDLDHRLGPTLGLLAEPRPLAAAQDHHRVGLGHRRLAHSSSR